MGKTLSYGSHNFPASAGFTGSSGSVASVKPFTRKIGARSTAMLPGAPAPKIAPRTASPKLAEGPSLAPRVVTSEAGKALGKAQLYAGYKKGGRVGKGKC